LELGRHHPVVLLRLVRGEVSLVVERVPHPEWLAPHQSTERSSLIVYWRRAQGAMLV
jgi:hypothetical protein